MRRGSSRRIMHRENRLGRINSSSRRVNHHTSTTYPYGPQYRSRQYFGLGYGYSRNSIGLGVSTLVIIMIFSFIANNFILALVIFLLFAFLLYNSVSDELTGPNPLNHPVPMNYRNADGTENKSSIRKRSYKKRSNPKYCEACSVAILPNAPFCGQCGTST